MKTFSLLFIVFLIVSCANEVKPLTAEDIVAKTIEASCSGNCEHAAIAFTFRNKGYKSLREGGSYKLERTTTDSTGTTVDVITNRGFQRFQNGSSVKVSDSAAALHSENVNSVHYFAQLPYGLNAPAARKELLGEAVIKGKNYYEIGVTFSEVGGGTDFEDSFVYWIHKENYTVDYLAYKYAVNGGGIRFREAYNPRVIEGIRFVDYNNYKPESLQTKLLDLDEKFEKGELKLLSKIESENVEVTLLKD